MCVGLAPAALAQQVASAGRDGQSTPTLTKDDVQRRLKDLEQSQAAEAVKSDATKRYKQALDWLTAAEQFTANIAAADADAEAAPRRVQEIKNQQSEPPAEQPPSPPRDATLGELERQLAEAESRLSESRESLDRLEADVKRRTDLKTRLPKLTADASQKLEALRKQLAAAPIAGELPEAALARRTELEANAIAVAQELAWYQAIARQGAAVTEWTPLALDLAQRKATRAEKQAAAWRRIVADRRKLESENQARAARRDIAKTHPALRQLAHRNAALAERRLKVAGEIERTAAERSAVESQVAALTAEFAATRQKVAVAGLTSTVALVLRHQRAALPDLTERRQRIETIEVEAPRLHLELLDLEAERQTVRDLDVATQNVIRGLDISTQRSLPDEATETIRDLLKAKRDYLDALLGDYQTYLEHTGAVELGTRKLVDQAEAFGDYLAENVLWMRSMEPVRLADADELRKSLVEVLRRSAAPVIDGTLIRVIADYPVQNIVFVVSLAALWVVRRRLRTRLRRLGEAAAGVSRQRFRSTLEVLALTMVLASLWPGVMFFLAWRLAAANSSSDLVLAFSAGLNNTALVFWTAELLRQICRPRGLAELHFGWPARGLATFRRRLTRMMVIALPLLLLGTVLERLHDRAGLDPAARIVFILGMIVIAAFAQRVLSPSQGSFATKGAGTTSGWRRFRRVWQFLAVGTPLALAVLAGIGYYYTAQQLAVRLQASVWMGIALVILHALVLRWVVIVGRRLRIKQVLHQHETAGATSDQSSHFRRGADATVCAPLDVAAVGLQVRQLLSAGLAVGLLIGGWIVWRDVLPALHVLDRVPLWTHVVTETQSIPGPSGEPLVRKVEREAATTLGHLVIAVVIVAGAVLAWRNIPGLLAMTVLERLPLNHGGRHAATALSRYVVLIAAGTTTFRLLGIGWANIQWLAAAMTVGLGFGLQEIFANFVSGLIILFERPVRVGDVVTVGGGTGTVTQIRMRATTITDSDRKELIVPNKKFITDEVINWTLSDPITRLVIRVGIAYGSDTQLAQRLLLKTARKHPLVLDEPEPSALFASFGASTLDFELRVFVPNREAHGVVQHDLNTAIERAFRDAKIEIAFPQQDLHIRSLPPLSFPLDARSAGFPLDARSAGFPLDAQSAASSLAEAVPPTAARSSEAA
jgi:potassium efflux system protein